MNTMLIIEKITKGKTRFWTRVMAVGIIFSMTAFLILLDMSKEYKASVSILIIAKNETSAAQLDRVVLNIAEFPKMLSFYERLLKSNPGMREDVLEKTKDEAKKLWNEKVEVENSDTNSIINLSVFSETSNDAKSLLAKTSENLFKVSSGYYDTEKEIELRVVDGPFVSVVSRKNTQIVVASIFVGILASIFLNILMSLVEKVFLLKRVFPSKPFQKKTGELILPKKPLESSKEKMEESYTYDVPYAFEETIPETEDYAEMIEEKQEPISKDEAFKSIFKDNPYPNYPEMPTAPKKALAPDNLPIAEGFDEDGVVSKESEFMEMKKHEPTDEELRERLNKLLRGEL